MTLKENLDNRFQAGTGATVGTKLKGLIALTTELRSELQKVRADLADVRTKFTAHLADGSHTAAANQTGGNVTANTPAALTSAASITAAAVTDDLGA